MSYVFIGGSKNFETLNEEVVGEILRLIHKDECIIVGNQNRIDKAIQRVVASVGYNNVHIYTGCTSDRNKAESYDAFPIKPTRRQRKSFLNKIVQDMINDAEYGFVIWDKYDIFGCELIKQLSIQKKIVTVYNCPNSNMFTIKKPVYNMGDIESAEMGVW